MVAERIAAARRRSAWRCRTWPAAASSGPTCASRTTRWRRIARIPTSARCWSSRSGCEQVVAQMLAESARAAGKPAEIVAIQSEGGTLRATAKGIAHRRRARARPARDSRASGATSPTLMLSLKCGGSDYTSGLAVESGARPRGRSPGRARRRGGARRDRRDHGRGAPARGARDATRRRPSACCRSSSASRAEAQALGLDIRGTQPSPGNIRGGLTTIEEKSLGATHKGGERRAARRRRRLRRAASRARA